MVRVRFFIVLYGSIYLDFLLIVFSIFGNYEWGGGWKCEVVVLSGVGGECFGFMIEICDVFGRVDFGGCGEWWSE